MSHVGERTACPIRDGDAKAATITELLMDLRKHKNLVELFEERSSGTSKPGSRPDDSPSWRCRAVRVGRTAATRQLALSLRRP
jgi:hypothetical protein